MPGWVWIATSAAYCTGVRSIRLALLDEDRDRDLLHAAEQIARRGVDRVHGDRGWLLLGIGLPVRGGVGERLDFFRRGFGLQQPRIGRDIDAEAPRIGKLRHQAEIGDGRRCAEAERARLRPRSAFRRRASPSRLAQAAHSVTFSSGRPSWRSRASTFRFCTGWVSQASAMREGADLGAAQRILRQQRRLGMGLVQPFDDGERLGQDRAGVVLQRRHQPLRIDREIGGRALFALAKVMRQVLGARVPSGSARS